MNSDKQPQVIEFYKFKILWVILLFALFGALFTAFPMSCDFSVPTTAPRGSGSQAEAAHVYRKPNPQIIRVEVDPEKWSDWVTIPVGYRWCIDRPGCWRQYWFWSEEKPRPRLEAGEHQWFGKIPETRFKLRGTKGTAEVIVEPK